MHYFPHSVPATLLPSSSEPIQVNTISSSSGDWQPVNHHLNLTDHTDNQTLDRYDKSGTDFKKDAKRKLRIVLSMAEPNPEPPSHALLLLGLTSAETRGAFPPSLKSNERIK